VTHVICDDDIAAEAAIRATRRQLLKTESSVLPGARSMLEEVEVGHRKKEKDLELARTRTAWLWTAQVRLQPPALMKAQEVLWGELHKLEIAKRREHEPLVAEVRDLRRKLQRVQAQRRSLRASNYAEEARDASAAGRFQSRHAELQADLIQRAEDAARQTQEAESELQVYQADMLHEQELIVSLTKSRDELRARRASAEERLAAVRSEVRRLQAEVAETQSALSAAVCENDRCKLLSPRLAEGLASQKQTKASLRDCFWGNLDDIKSHCGRSRRMQHFMALERQQEQQKLLAFAQGHSARAFTGSGFLGQGETPAFPFHQQVALERASADVPLRLPPVDLTWTAGAPAAPTALDSSRTTCASARTQ